MAYLIFNGQNKFWKACNDEVTKQEIEESVDFETVKTCSLSDYTGIILGRKTATFDGTNLTITDNDPDGKHWYQNQELKDAKDQFLFLINCYLLGHPNSGVRDIWINFQSTLNNLNVDTLPTVTEIVYGQPTQVIKAFSFDDILATNNINTPGIVTIP
jgi:hypothetical protein